MVSQGKFTADDNGKPVPFDADAYRLALLMGFNDDVARKYGIDIGSGTPNVLLLRLDHQQSDQQLPHYLPSALRARTPAATPAPHRHQYPPLSEPQTDEGEPLLPLVEEHTSFSNATTTAHASDRYDSSSSSNDHLEQPRAPNHLLHGHFVGQPFDALYLRSASRTPSAMPEQTPEGFIPANSESDEESLADDSTNGDAILPDTYKGRRSKEAREEFPWECDHCKKKFLYLNSLQKHQRMKHEGLPEAINMLRQGALARPPPAIPRNEAARAARQRQKKAKVPRAVTTPSAIFVRSPQPATMTAQRPLPPLPTPPPIRHSNVASSFAAPYIPSLAPPAPTTAPSVPAPMPSHIQRLMVRMSSENLPALPPRDTLYEGDTSLTFCPRSRQWYRLSRHPEANGEYEWWYANTSSWQAEWD